jgi:hypothetical protein
MKTNFKRLALNTALAALAAGALASPSFADTPSDATPEIAQQALVAQMGDAARNLTVSVDRGEARLSGWAKGPKEVNQARYLVSKLAGVEHAYSSAVHTWNSSDHS